jgi:hypothetical protein
MLAITYTVKTVLTATTEQRPPDNNGQPKPGQINLNSNFDRKPFKAATFVQRPLFWGPKGGRCRQVWLYIEKKKE